MTTNHPGFRTPVDLDALLDPGLSLNQRREGWHFFQRELEEYLEDLQVGSIGPGNLWEEVAGNLHPIAAPTIFVVEATDQVSIEAASHALFVSDDEMDVTAVGALDVGTSGGAATFYGATVAVNATSGDIVLDATAGDDIRLTANDDIVLTSDGHNVELSASQHVNLVGGLAAGPGSELDVHTDINLVAERQIMQTARDAAPDDMQFVAEQISFYLDEAADVLKVRVLYSDSLTFMNGEIPLFPDP